MHYYGDMGFWGMHFFWWIFWVALIAVMFSIFQPVPRSRNKEHKNQSPLEILQRRYASGELSDAEYEKKKSRLARDVKGTGFSTNTNIKAY